MCVGLVRLGTKGEMGTGLILVGALILFVAIGIYYQFGRSLGDGGEGEGPGPIRLFRMAFIWYILALVLSVSFVRGPLKQMGSDGNIGYTEWGMGILGVVVVGFALWRIIRIVPKIKNK